MYFHPKDGYPELKKYKGFSVGDIVKKKGFYNMTLGHIVRIYQPPYDKTPYIEIEWFGNGRTGIHDADNLELYRTHAQWMEDIQKQREQEKVDKEKSKQYFSDRKKENAKKRFSDLRKQK